MHSTKNVPEILAQIRKGGIPEKFTYEHLKQMGFASSRDRPLIPLLKEFGFLDDNGVPQERYRQYKEPRNAKRVLGDGIKAAYADVFGIDENAHKLDQATLTGIFGRLSEKSESVAEKMARTFRAFSDQAEFAAATGEEDESDEEEEEDEETAEQRTATKLRQGVALHHDVHIHLPVSTEIAVYDAIFRSLRENLLT